MKKEKDFYSVVEMICLEDPRYKADAYEFIMQALYFTQNKLKKDTHVTGKELLEGVRSFIIEQYGPMAKTVFAHWGITKTEDLGNIVFNLINKKILSKTEEDSLNDFKEVYDFETAFGNVLRDAVIKDAA
jgi:uncharacterized repeat protein (TIGR04138 family)